MIFRFPFNGSYLVTSPYGPREGGFHPGIDFGCPTGTPVLASAAGTVQYAAYEDGAGNTVTLRHEGTWETRYDHLDRWTVELGQHVDAGQQIGVSNNTGASTGAHLHFEIRIDHDMTVDPMPFLIPPPPAPDPAPPEVDVLSIVLNDQNNPSYGTIAVVGEANFDILPGVTVGNAASFGLRPVPVTGGQWNAMQAARNELRVALLAH